MISTLPPRSLGLTRLRAVLPLMVLVLQTGVVPAHAETLTGVTKAKFNASYPSIQGKILTLDNVRVKSSTTTTADLVSAAFKFDTGTLTFNLQDAYVVRGVGVFNQDQSGFVLFGKDAPADFTLTTAGGQQYRSNQKFVLTTAGEPMTLDLTSGQVLTFQFANANDNFNIQIVGPDGRTILDKFVQLSGSPLDIQGGIAIPQSGRHTLRLTPTTKRSLQANVFMHQDNDVPLRALRSGDGFSNQFLYGSTEYAKYAITLNQGDTLEVADAGSAVSGIKRLLMFQDSSLLYFQFGSGSIFYKATATGTYYLFVYNRNVEGGGFSGRISITR